MPKTDGPSGHPDSFSQIRLDQTNLAQTFGEPNLSFELTYINTFSHSHSIHRIGIFTYISHLNYANVNKYIIHGWYGIGSMYYAWICFLWVFLSMDCTMGFITIKLAFGRILLELFESIQQATPMFTYICLCWQNFWYPRPWESTHFRI